MSPLLALNGRHGLPHSSSVLGVYAGAILNLAEWYCEPLLPFGAMPLHVGMGLSAPLQLGPARTHPASDARQALL